MAKASYIEAYQVFAAETHRWTESNGGKSQQEILADYHKNYRRNLDTKLREVGWTLSEFQDHKSTPEESKAVRQLLHKTFPNVVEARADELEPVKDMSN